MFLQFISLWPLQVKKSNYKIIQSNSDCARGRAKRGSNPGRDKRFFSSTKRPDRLWSPPSLQFNEHRGSFPGKTQPEREINHSPPSRGKIKNEWRYTSTLPYAFKVWTGITLPLRLQQIQDTTGSLTTNKTEALMTHFQYSIMQKPNLPQKKIKPNILVRDYASSPDTPGTGTTYKA
jgi:hypothetical protein